MNNNIYADKIKKHRRLRFGALAVSLTVAVVALVIVVNAVFSALAQKFMLYADMTKEKIYGITEQSKDLLDDYRGTKEFSISIVFCQYADQLDSSYESKLVHNLAKQYAEEFDFVKVEYVDIINHPEAVNRYLATSVSQPKTTSVYIVKHDLTKPDEDKLQSRIYTLRSFYTFDSDTNKVFAFNGEYKMTAGILQLAGDSPVAYFVTGHGEKTEKSVMWTLFEDAGFDVKNIDLSKENLSDAAKVVVINDPKYDFMGAGGTVNEIKKLSDYLGNFGGLMVFMDPETGKLEELETLLSEWGIEFQRSTIRDFSNALDVNGRELVGEYTTEGTGASLTKNLRELESSPKAIFKNAMPINPTYSPNTDGTYTSAYGSSSRIFSPIFTTSSKKTAEAIPTGAAEEAGIKGVYNLMTVTVDSRYIKNEPHYSYVLAAGTASFADDAYIGGRSYANRDIIFNAMKNFGRKTVPLDLDFKVFEDEGLDITKAQANRLTVLITVVPSVIVFGVGIYVWTRRRYL